MVSGQDATRVIPWIAKHPAGGGCSVVCRLGKRLPKTNCRKCGQPTCMAFAARVTKGAMGVDHCPPLKCKIP